MLQDDMKNWAREGIVKKSIQILRTHGKSDEEIKQMMLKDFLINEEVLDELLKATKK